MIKKDMRHLTQIIINNIFKNVDFKGTSDMLVFTNTCLGDELYEKPDNNRVLIDISDCHFYQDYPKIRKLRKLYSNKNYIKYYCVLEVFEKDHLRNPKDIEADLCLQLTEHPNIKSYLEYQKLNTVLDKIVPDTLEIKIDNEFIKARIWNKKPLIIDLVEFKTSDSDKIEKRYKALQKIDHIYMAMTVGKSSEELEKEILEILNK